ncbi:MAG: thiosulfate oxidation carrier protein SoxY [Candidatus Rokuibacteriota bacterium]
MTRWWVEPGEDPGEGAGALPGRGPGDEPGPVAWRPELPPARRCSRRTFLTLTAGAVGLLGEGFIQPTRAASRRHFGALDDPDLDSPRERLHRPRVELPIVASDGAKVPVVIQMSHPMEPGHHITTIHVTNEQDPVPSKGVFHLSPGNGQVYLSFQCRMHVGSSETAVTAQCTRDGEWSATRSITVPEGAGGCAAPAPKRLAPQEIGAPVLRVPELLKRRHIPQGVVVLVQLLMRHPSRTGLALVDGRWVQESEPFYVQMIEVRYGEEPLSRFELTSALSDNPFIGFRVRARHRGPLRAVVTNSRGQRFEASQDLPLA